MPPCIIFEDEHLLVINKPAGLNTHAPSPYAGEGIYDWLRHREPRWANLAIIHRLDKETSGVMLFSKTPAANRSLTEQFTQRRVRKRYVLVTDHPVAETEFRVRTGLARAGERYVSRPLRSGGEAAETGFRLLGDAPGGLRGCQALEAAPLTGRTHQIRVHAAEKGFPILGDRLYGGSAARRVYLHSSELTIVHPVSSKEMSFRAEPDFEAEPGDGLRAALIEPELTNAYRLIHGASDGWPGWYVERAGDFLLSQAELPLGPEQAGELARLVKALSLRGAYHKILRRRLRQAALVSVGPRLVLGEAAPKQILIRENGVEFGLSFEEGYSAGLFLDQRDNRRRLLTGHIAADFPLLRPDANKQDWELLNAFAYTCGFSVCAARAGARTTNLDLSKKYLEWGRQNFALNTLDPDAHQFIYGDAFDWLRRLGRKKRVFDVVLLDPPTFSQSKESGVFQADKDYRRLVSVALPLLRSGGVLFASTNAADWKVEGFISAMDAAIRESGRKILQRHYGPQPPDFPVSRAEPAYLKTVWLRLQ